MPKVHTGCLTCKQRRVKCDETRPICRNCSHTGRPCEGYLQPRADSQTPIQVYSLPFKVPGSQADRQLLHFYIVEAAEELSSFLDSTLWTRLILQRCHDQPVIRHSLVTLSALYRDSLSARPDLSNAMQRIARCHRQLRLHLQSAGASVDTALICSVLFFAFEMLIRDAHTATLHLNNALNLLKHADCHSSSELLPHLTSILSRLDIHASAIDDDRMPMLSLVTPAETSGTVGTVPDELSTLEEAEAVLTKLQNWLLHTIIVHVAHKHDPPGALPLDILHERLVLHQQFERFFVALDVLAARLLALDRSNRPLLLRIQARMYSAILIENIPHLKEQTPNDSLQTALQDIQAFHFTLSSQLVAVLYFLCLKTNNAQNRDAALSLLQHSSLPARDGLWESSKAVFKLKALIERTIRQEEQSLAKTVGWSEQEGGIEHVLHAG
ncbi:hypothetical protein BJY00DRAFT_322034 [Aspergillus carlsbadensis]|nr:hypothetical protein BJY00DRAFT_322034 [Aspergillus carlsbadensis]